jgi:hypothetical protein
VLEQIKFLESQYDLYKNLEGFNFKDFFDMLGIKSLYTDYRTSDIMNFYFYNITNPLPLNSLPSILFEAFSYINSIFKFGVGYG